MIAITPGQALFGLRFGAARSSVRAVLGPDFDGTNRISPGCPADDFWVQKGLFASYDESAELIAFEVCPPASVAWGAVSLLPGLAADFIRQVEREGHSWEVLETVVVSRTANLSVWAPDLLELGREAAVETVLTFKAGYYDGLISRLGSHRDL